MDENPIYRVLDELSEFLAENKVRYALIGGLAVAVHGEPRATLDIDAVLDVDVEFAIGILETLPSSGFRPFSDRVEEIVRTGLLLPLEHKETRIRVDLSLGLSGFDREAIFTAQKLSIGGCDIQVVGAEYLVVMKIVASRPRDLEDVKGIISRKGSDFDWKLTNRLASELSAAVDDDLLGKLENLSKP